MSMRRKLLSAYPVAIENVDKLIKVNNKAYL